MSFKAITIRQRVTAFGAIVVTLSVLMHATLIFLLAQQRAYQQLDAQLMTEVEQLADRHFFAKTRWHDEPRYQTVDIALENQASLDIFPLDPVTNKPLRWQRLRGDVSPDGSPFSHESLSRYPEARPFTLETRRGAWRVVHTVARNPQLGDLLICASQPLSTVEEELAVFARHALHAAVLILLLGIAGTWFLVDAALGPIKKVIANTKARNPNDLNARIPSPRTDDEIEQLTVVINGLLTRVEKMVERQAAFVTAAAHELRTPLTAQRMSGELALRENFSPEALRESVSTMLEDNEHMRRLIDGLLLIARAEGGLLGAAAETTDIVALAQEANQMLEPLAESSGHKLTYEPLVVNGSSTPVYARVDPTLIRQAILNLIHNAIHHTGSGTVITVRAGTDRDGCATVSVHDNGSGFAPFDKREIIKRRRATPAVKSTRGLGLGLTIAESLVKSQSGAFLIESALGHGTSITMRFKTVQGSEHLVGPGMNEKSSATDDQRESSRHPPAPDHLTTD